ncbi:hypothetical protein TIFTF001_017697 [Ficus carica]|uniref:Uncharacterized protein n=1 Tax=Ficus carica TaxID=3494 RepID=A0AA88A2T8_FICCA|nr:hypothetical protein TIFTF001_017697 [Ficus carica]
MDAFSRLKIEGAALTPARTPLYGFSGECDRAAGTVSLPVTIGDGPERVTRMVEFIVVDRPSVYNVILGRPTLNAIKAVVSTYHLAMKVPAEGGVGVFRGNQEGARKCYMEAVNKVCLKAPAPITVATVFAMDEAEAPSGDVARGGDPEASGQSGQRWKLSYDRAPTRIGRARLGPTCPCRHLLCSSRTTGLMTGHRPELDVPDQDPPTGSHLQPTKVGVG